MCVNDTVLFIRSDVTVRLFRLKYGTPSDLRCAVFVEMLVGTYFADVVTIMENGNIGLGWIDR
ncbi:hypothetical protein [Campylobacter coli]|uniref:hypothetical protein n=1 Tax=Campylobacter coli TaxID=195 RepID=UPI00383AEDD1